MFGPVGTMGRERRDGIGRDPTAREGRVWRALARLTTIVFLTAAPAEASVVSETFDVRGWRGAAYLEEPRGPFSHCAVYSDYPGGTTLYFSLDSAGTLAVAMINEGWKLAPSDVEKVTVVVDRGARATLPGRLAPASMLIIDVGVSTELVNAIAQGHRLVIATAHDDFAFDLRATPAAFTRLRQCVDMHGIRADAGGRHGGLTALVESGRATNSTSAATPRRLTLRDRLSARDVADLLDHAGLQYSFVRPDDAKRVASPFDYAWRTEEGVFGALVQLPRADASVEALSSAFIASMNDGCQGNYGMGSRPATPALGSLVRRAISSCTEADHTVNMFYTIVSGPALVTLVLSYAEDPGLATQADDKILGSIEDLLWPKATLH